MRNFFIVLLGLYLISGCKSVNNPDQKTEIPQKIVNCPQPPSQKSTISIDRESYGFFDAFNYQINEIIATEDTIVFESLNHKFTLCEANNNWIVETINEPQSNQDKNLQSNQNHTIQVDDQTYKYSVRLDNKSEQAIFELITPQSTAKKSQILYTLQQTQQAEAGFELAEPEISSVRVYNNQIFWSIFTYRGEGFGGIATIVSYDLTNDKFTLIQPPEIAIQIINDLVIAGNPDNPTFWLATQLTGEGNPYIPSMGLVSYRPNNADYTQGTIESYHIRNSPIIGAIPTKLHLEDDILWIGTGNGICQLEWQNITNKDSWSCWRFAVMANLPSEGLPIYPSLLDDSVNKTLMPTDTETTVEVLWWSFKQAQPLTGRYEIRYEPGFTVELNYMGAIPWDEYYYDEIKPPAWEAPLYWAGSNWHWQDNRFIRSLDQVELNLVGGGVMGIRPEQPNDDYIFDTNAIRGDLELLELTKNSTKVQHYSAWVEDSFLQPYLTIIPQSSSSQSQPNPLLSYKPL